MLYIQPICCIPRGFIQRRSTQVHVYKNQSGSIRSPRPWVSRSLYSSRECISCRCSSQANVTVTVEWAVHGLPLWRLYLTSLAAEFCSGFSPRAQTGSGDMQARVVPLVISIGFFSSSAPLPDFEQQRNQGHEFVRGPEPTEKGKLCRSKTNKTQT